jgi:hypothetical protein
MRVLILETNLLWSARLKHGVVALGHEAVVSAFVPEDASFDVAILNLGEPRAPAWAASLAAKGVPAIGHAGHKEKDLLDLGRSLGIARCATNSELTHKLPAILAEFGPSPASGTQPC